MTQDRFPLTPLQHAMVGAWLRRPHSGINVEQWIVTLREPVHAPLLRAAWRDMVRNYGMLRAAIDLTDPGNPQQTIGSDVGEAWEEVDWRDAQAAEQAARWREFLEADRCRGLDLTRPPLWRVVLIRTADDEYHFVCTYHHVLLGGRSLVQLGRETFARYDALTRGESPPAEPEAPFRKFVECLGRFDRTASAAYWRRYLSGRAPVRLPEPHAPPVASADYRRAHRSIECQHTLDAAATARLYAAARGADVTLHTLAQAAWGLTLAAFTGEDDHVFGSVRACRKLPVEGIPRMVGMLINTVPFRVQLRRDETLEQLLGRLREAQVEHRLHETTAASDLARYVCQPADEPLFPTLLMFTDRRPETMLDVAGRPHPTRSVQLLERSEFPLALAFGVDEVTSIRLEYDTECYSAATAERVLRHFVMTLEALPDYLGRSIDDLPSVTPADRERLFVLSRSPHAPNVTLTVPAMIERRTEAAPRDVAIVAGSRRVTYAELRRMATVAAANLRRRGIGRGALVGVFCERSPEMVAAVLGLWRIGAVYVPLDPKYPSQRLQAIVADAAPALVVCDRPPPESIDDRLDRTVALDRLFDVAKHAADADDGPATTLADRAVVLYTSGSTGTPKGVVLTHGNLANQTAYVVRTLQLAAGDRLAPVSSINFDASLEEHFSPLAAGATIVLGTGGDALDSCGRFFEFVERERLTILDLPTSLWRELTNFLHDERRFYPSCVRAIMLGGEAATRTAYERFLKVGGRNIRWLNAYGPTETTICSTVYEHRPDRDADEPGSPPIGRPIDNTTAYIVDRRGRLVPPGVRGELLLGGAGVAEGYLNRDDLTRERFTDAPSGDVPPGRYYRTGDEVRFREDGELEYVGRLDEQMKLRGFRIEPGEIETVLLKHAAVRDAAVVVRASAVGTQYLAAYVVLHAGAAWDERSLREFAAARLPQYMQPQALVEIDALPLSPNGKIDRRALPEPCLDHRDPTTAGAKPPPRVPTLLERRMLDVWQSTLAIDDLGLDDDFFSLGGDSLRAMTLVAKLEQALGRPVSAAALVAAPTVARLAAYLESNATADDNGESSALVLLRPGDDKRPLFFVHSLAGDVWIYRDLVQALRSGVAVYGLQMPGLGGATPPTSDDVETWAAVYVERVRTMQPVGPYRFAGYSSGGLLAFEMARQLHDAGETVEFLGLIDSGVPAIVEGRLTASRRERYVNALRGLVGYLNEFRRQSFAEQRRRIGRLAAKFVRKRFANRRAVAAGGDITDRDVLECFAEDISFFPAERLDLIRRHYRALEVYDPPAAEVAAHLFRSARQPLFAVQTPTMGWEVLVRGSLSVHQIGGAHATLMRTPYVERLAAALDAALEHELAAGACPQLTA